MDTTTLKYYDSLNVLHTQAFDVLSVRGFDDPDRVRFVPPILYDKIDGSKETAFRGFQRIITIELKALNSLEDFIRAFMQAEDRAVSYRGQYVSALSSYVVFESAEYENEWLNDFQYTKKYVIEVVDATVRTTFPFPPSDSMIGVSISNVKIEGTQQSPELFTTNIDKLQYRFGTTPFPDIDLDDYNVTIHIMPRSDAKINQVGAITQAGTNISFYLAIGDGAIPINDGGIYDGEIRVDIAILMDAKI